MDRETYNLIFLILNFAEFPALDKMQSSIQLLMTSRSCLDTLMGQLFTETFTEPFVLLTPFFFVYPTRVFLFLNDLELKTQLLSTAKSALSAGTSSLLNFPKLLDVSE